MLHHLSRFYTLATESYLNQPKKNSVGFKKSQILMSSNFYKDKTRNMSNESHQHLQSKLQKKLFQMTNHIHILNQKVSKQQSYKLLVLHLKLGNYKKPLFFTNKNKTRNKSNKSHQHLKSKLQKKKLFYMTKTHLESKK